MFRKTLSRTIRVQTHSDWVSLFTGWMTIISIRVWSQIEIPDNTSNSYYNRNHHEEKLEEESTPQSHPCQIPKKSFRIALWVSRRQRVSDRAAWPSPALSDPPPLGRRPHPTSMFGDDGKHFFVGYWCENSKRLLNRCLKSLKKRTMENGDEEQEESNQKRNIVRFKLYTYATRRKVLVTFMKTG